MTHDPRHAALPFSHVAVIGAGQMGAGIAQVCATAGCHVTVRDVDAEQAAKGKRAIEASTAKLVEKGKLTAGDRDAALARISFTDALGAAAQADLVIEAIVEDLEAKRALWRELDELAPPSSVFATNTSSLKVADQAEVTDRPDRFLGLHFFNPVPLMGLVEVVSTAATDPGIVASATDFVRTLGKEPVLARDTTGFIVNVLLIPYLLDAIRLLERGGGTIGDIDTAMKLGAGYPMGPFTLLDTVGLDTMLRTTRALFAEFGEPRLQAPAMLERLVAAGRLGRKSGKGFYDWSVVPAVPVESEK
ncbi:MAG TPA: 3-hydroxyacyl-CoA dehydrogenase family protein [Gemmatimonadales bacterium]|nr:3-hydroxyacyl-CoA dehydrogenase family protein [Gemmatimonadales bacterium]